MSQGQSLVEDGEQQGSRASDLSVAHRSPQELPFLLTIEEVAAWLRTTPKAIYALKDRGRLPGAVHRGRRLLVRRDDLLASLAEVGALSPKGNRR
ncbi:MAG: helix-turn-helix domain-containing protein [Myxococcaceae bacterium]